MRVDQVIPSFAARDAIGAHTAWVSEALRSAGIDSEIYYGHCPTPEFSSLGRPVTELGRARKDRYLLYQASIGSPVFDLVVERSEPKLVNYHNITPAPLLADWEPAVGYELELGRRQLERMAGPCAAAIAVSRFNASELESLGYRRTCVVPLLFDASGGRCEPDPWLRNRLGEEKATGGADLLYVGKLSPHKAPHDLVKMLAVYRRLFDPEARLHLVGSPLGTAYPEALAAFVGRLGLDGAVEMAGTVSGPELEAYYASADVFVSASEHEGFCAPLVEAMGRGLPVVAYGAGAVPETVAQAGLVLATKEPLRFATAVAKVTGDPVLDKTLRAAGTERAGAFDLERSKAAMVAAVAAATTGR